MLSSFTFFYLIWWSLSNINCTYVLQEKWWAPKGCCWCTLLFGSCAWRGFHNFYSINSQTSTKISLAGLEFFYLYFLVDIPWCVCDIKYFVLQLSKSSIQLQHKEFEEIEGRLQRREPLILGITASQRLNRRLPVEVISDPLDDVEIDPYEDGSDAHKLRGHQVPLCD